MRHLWLVLGVAAMLAVLLMAAADWRRPIALHPTFRPEADDGDGRTLRLIDVHSIEDFAAAVGAAYGRPVQVHWNQLELAKGRALEFAVAEIDVAGAFRLVNAQMLQLCPTISWRTFPTHVEIGERSYFDKLEVERREYDLTGTVLAWRGAATEASPSPCSDAVMRKAADLVETIEDEYWEARGGDVARLAITGATLIVDAPRDMHPRIAKTLEIYANVARRAQSSNPKPVKDRSWSGSGGSPMCFGPGSAWDGGVAP